MKQAGVLSAGARVAVEEQLGPGDCEEAGKPRRVPENAKEVGKMWQSKVGKLTKDIEINQVWIDLQALGIQDEEWNEIGRSHGVGLDGPRLVFHHQTGGEAIQQLGRAFIDFPEGLYRGLALVLRVHPGEATNLHRLLIRAAY